MQEQVEALEDEIARLEGAARLEKQRELVNLFIGAGRSDRAAVAQEAVAEAEGSAEAWKRAGDLYYDWMDSLEGVRKGEVARKTIAAYQRVLDQNPDDLDVRTDMAVAYLYDPEHPMEAIRQTNLVLEKDPNHIQANFNRGIMLMQVNRLDQAVEQFERVKQLVGERSPIFQQAESVIQTIRSKQAGQGGT